MALCRRLRTALLGLSTALWASPGLAQTSTSITTSTTTSLTTSDFTLALQEQSGNTWVDLTTTQAATYLNQARCQCATPVQILVQMAPASTSKLASLTTVGTEARLYVGTNCASLDANNVPTCPDSQILGEMNGIANLARAPWYVPTTVDKLFAPLGGCSPAQSTTTISLWLDSTGDGYPDSGVTGSAAPSLGITAIGTPPSAPDGITVEGGDEALVVSWSPISTTTVPNLAGFLVFCMRGNGLQVFNPSYYNYSSDYNNSSNTSQYLTSQILCPPGTTPATPTSFTSVKGTTTAEEVGAPNQFLNLDPNYLCSGLLPPTQTNLRLEILQNGIPYTVGVAAVDTSGNASPIESGFVQKPVPTINFYQEYRDAGGQSLGGYCALAGRDAQLGAISLLAGIGLLALIILRRRRRARREGL